MSDNTEIEWCDSTWNPVRGCSKVSGGCAFCYAETFAARFSGPGLPYSEVITDGKWNGKISFIPSHLLNPFSWKEPRLIFVNSMSDLFHENCETEWVDQIFAVMALNPRHTFQILTKRPERMMEYFNSKTPEQDVWIEGQKKGGQHFRYDGVMKWPLPNVWAGISVEDQATWNKRSGDLRATNAAVRFVSYEPALGPINFGNVAGLNGIHWVIMGGESGDGARPMHVTWARSVRDQCAEMKVPFLFKQWGEWGWWQGGAGHWARHKPTQFVKDPGTFSAWMTRVGKKSAGRELDGRLHDEMPGGKHVRSI